MQLRREVIFTQAEVLRLVSLLTHIPQNSWEKMSDGKVLIQISYLIY